MPLAWAARNSFQVGPPRGAGPRPWRRSTRRIELAETRTPSPRSSPWMRTHPQRRFSRPSLTMSSTISSPSGARPGPRWARHRFHLLLESSRCQRNRVSGCPKLSVGGIRASQERGTRRDSRDGGPWQMMVDGAEERQLKGPIDVLAPYTSSSRGAGEHPSRRSRGSGSIFSESRSSGSMPSTQRSRSGRR
jgi:hypothetical protein